jgi:hypothetical protein
MALATNYTNGALDTNVNEKRIYRLTSTDGTVFFEGTIDEITTYKTEPSVYGAPDINETNQAVNNITPEDGTDIVIED